MSQLSHVDEQGRVRMVNTGNKEISSRRAVASARVLMSAETVSALREHRTPKGDPLEAARLAGIMAAKKTAELIPLCHPLPLTHIDVQAKPDDTGVLLEAEVSTNAQTGVEISRAITSPLGNFVLDQIAESARASTSNTTPTVSTTPTAFPRSVYPPATGDGGLQHGPGQRWRLDLSRPATAA